MVGGDLVRRHDRASYAHVPEIITGDVLEPKISTLRPLS